MGLGGISIWQLAIILVIVLLLFGTKKLRNLGGDLGGALKGFKKAMSEDEAKDSAKDDELKKVDSTAAEDLNASKTKESSEAK